MKRVRTGITAAILLVVITVLLYAGMNTINVGGGQTTLVALGDSANLGNVATIDQAHTGDAQSFASGYSLLVKVVPFLVNAGGTNDRLRSAVGTTGVLPIDSESVKTTYSNGVIAFTPAATATDFWSIVGSGSKTIRVTRLQVSGIATAAATVDVQLAKRSTANTGGTPTNPAIVPHDKNDAAATAVITTYGANPSLGSLVGYFRGQKLNLGAAGSAGTIVWDFTVRNTKGVLLRGTADSLSLNWNGAAVPAGTSLDIDVEWTEE